MATVISAAARYDSMFLASIYCQGWSLIGLVVSVRRTIMNLPKVRSVVYDPQDPKGEKLVLFRLQSEGV